MIVIFDVKSDEPPLHDQFNQYDIKVLNSERDENIFPDSLFPYPTYDSVGLSNQSSLK